jgi:hypothetical protein
MLLNNFKLVGLGIFGVFHQFALTPHNFSHTTFVWCKKAYDFNMPSFLVLEHVGQRKTIIFGIVPRLV